LAWTARAVDRSASEAHREREKRNFRRPMAHPNPGRGAGGGADYDSRRLDERMPRGERRQGWFLGWPNRTSASWPSMWRATSPRRSASRQTRQARPGPTVWIRQSTWRGVPSDLTLAMMPPFTIGIRWAARRCWTRTSSKVVVPLESVERRIEMPEAVLMLMASVAEMSIGRRILPSRNILLVRLHGRPQPPTISRPMSRS
jgi:hypothetical protein